MNTYTITDEQRRVIVSQMRRMDIFAISGGIVHPLPDGIRLPAGNGYNVDIHLTPADDYTVERVFVRNGKTTSHGAETMVYCDELSDTAYRASCYRNNDADYWPAALEVKS